MAAKRTLGWVSGLTLLTMLAGCAAQTPSQMAPQAEAPMPNLGPAIIEGDALILPIEDRTIQSGKQTSIRWTVQDFKTLPQKIEAAGGQAQDLISSRTLSSMYPGAFNMAFPGAWPGSWAGGPGYCPSPYGVAFGTPAILPKTLFIHPDVYYLRRHSLYFPYSRLGGYFYPISVPYGAQFYTPILAYGFGSLSPYTFSSATCPLGQPFPGTIPGGPGYMPPGGQVPVDDGQAMQYGKQHGKQTAKQYGQKQYGQRMNMRGAY